MIEIKVKKITFQEKMILLKFKVVISFALGINIISSHVQAANDLNNKTILFQSKLWLIFRAQDPIYVVGGQVFHIKKNSSS